TPAKKIKAGWIYVGPIGDYGWTYAHNAGREYVEKRFAGTVETVYIESVPEAECLPKIESLIAEGCEIDNMGTYFAELYQPYYLCGLVAGAISQTLKFGYVAAYPIPEVVRHINSWVLGIWEGLWHRYKRGDLSLDDLKKAEVHVKWLYSWYDPPAATDAARSLVEMYDADVLAFTEDSPATLQVAEEYQKAGRKVWSYSHYSSMIDYGPTAHLMGQLVDWGLMYEYILAY
ncbi:MAG: BMP family ABC transporter substrate-binding protein, partial [Desulfurococcales archaeon ex4484_217_2]